MDDKIYSYWRDRQINLKPNAIFDHASFKDVKAYKKTAMREPVSIFEEFLSNLASTWKGKLIEKSDEKMEF